MVSFRCVCASILVAYTWALYDSEGEELLVDVALLQTTVNMNELPRHHRLMLSQVAQGLNSSNASNPVSVSAQVSGVETNAAGDLETFFTGIVTNTAATFACVVIFIMGRARYPMMYQFNCERSPEEIRVPDKPAQDWSGWAISALAKTHEEHVKYSGLDHAMLLEFTAMSMRMLMKIGIPMLVVMGSLNFFFGHGEAEEVGDNLSRIAMGNVSVGHPWLYYVYGVITILVVWVVRNETLKSMRMFCKSRFHWLKTLKTPQAATVMVEGIPDEYQSDDKVQEYFSRMFSAKDIKEANVCKNMPELETVYAELGDAVNALAKVEQEWENSGKKDDNRPQMKSMLMSSTEDAIDYWKNRVEEKKKEVEQYRESVIKDAKAGPGGVNGHSGFVTFADCRNARVAVNTKFSADRTTWLVSQAPAPQDIIWSDMKVNVELRSVKRAIGYGLVFGLYVAFTPFCLFVTNLATTINLGPFQSLWAAYAPTLGLLIFLSFAPTVLINIFSWLFNLKSEVSSQLQLQNWYFWFMVFFVIGVTVVGQDFVNFIEKIAQDPLKLPMILADKMPASTHYYLNFLALQWMVHGMVLTRYIPVAKFVAASKIWSEEDARVLSEPEDQDYYGMGSRSARFTINLLIAMIFGTISPLMSLLAWINFYLCNLFYGYLFVYAESKKSDSGGYFFIAQLHHVYAGLIFYTLLMIGMFLSRAPNYVPAGFGIAALVFAVMSYRAFTHDFEWEGLPWEELAPDADGNDFVPGDTGESYRQPELEKDLKALISAGPSSSS